MSLTRITPLSTGIVVPDATSAAAVSMPFVLVQILFSGFYLTRASIPPWFIWAYYISFFRYALAIVVKNLFHTLRFCPCAALFCPFGPDGSGADVERQYGVGGDSMVMLFGVCIGYAVLIIAIGYLALVLQLRVKLQRKAPRGNANGHGGAGIAARVLDLPPYALAFATRAAGQQGGGAAGGQHGAQQEPRRRFLFRRRRAPAA
jgi:hypothetical protein